MLPNFLAKLVRPEILRITGYQSARTLTKAAQIQLDANENTFGTVLPNFPKLKLQCYPDPLATALRYQLAQYLKVPTEQILVGNGSDELIGLITTTFVAAREGVLLPEPTFAYYADNAKLRGASLQQFWLPDFKFNVAKVLRQIRAKTKIIFLCSPNNPTGQIIPLAAISEICRQSQKIVVVDEAYIEFAPQFSAAALLKKFPNLIILRTFSKAWGLAGLRLGYLLADARLVAILRKVRAPYSVNTLSAYLAGQALARQKQVARLTQKIILAREEFFQDLQKLNLRVFPSQANFLLIEFPTKFSAPNFQKKLLRELDIAVRVFPQEPRLQNFWRVTVGKPEQNKKVVRFLQQNLN